MAARKKLAEVDYSKLTCNSPIKKSDAIRFVADKLDTRRGMARDVRGRVRKRIEYDIGKGKLKVQSQMRMLFGDLTWWVKDAYPEIDISGFPMNVYVELKGQQVKSEMGKLDPFAEPATVEACKAALIAERARSKALEQLLEEANKTIATLRKEKTDRYRERQSYFGKQGGRGNCKEW